MYKKHTPQRPDGFAKYRLRQSQKAKSTFQQLPASKQRALRRNLIFVGATLSIILVLSLLSKAYAAGGSYVVDDGARRYRGPATMAMAKPRSAKGQLTPAPWPAVPGAPARPDQY